MVSLDLSHVGHTINRNVFYSRAKNIHSLQPEIAIRNHQNKAYSRYMERDNEAFIFVVWNTY